MKSIIFYVPIPNNMSETIVIDDVSEIKMSQNYFELYRDDRLVSRIRKESVIGYEVDEKAEEGAS